MTEGLGKVDCDILNIFVTTYKSGSGWIWKWFFYFPLKYSLGNLRDCGLNGSSALGHGDLTCSNNPV